MRTTGYDWLKGESQNGHEDSRGKTKTKDRRRGMGDATTDKRRSGAASTGMTGRGRDVQGV
eukprot:3258035-Pleurochrysis_carterae.AAC.1